MLLPPLAGVPIILGNMLLQSIVSVWYIRFTSGDFAVNFATLGYGNIVMSARWKLPGPLEAVNGALMSGLSGACMPAVLQHHIRKQLKYIK